jgi:hypothetical protein
MMTAAGTGARGSATRLRSTLSIATAMYREIDMGFWVEQAETEAKEIER